MKFKSLILVLTVITTAIFCCLWGSTYAYYTVANGTEINARTGNINTGLAVVFTQSQYINTTTGIPIFASDVDTYADKTVFTLVPDREIFSNSDVMVTISLIDIHIDEELIVDDFKYDLNCTDGVNNVTLDNGSGLSFNNEVINNNTLQLGYLSTSDGNFDITKNYTCTLRTWLVETGENQNNLMGKSFSSFVKVDTLFKK